MKFNHTIAESILDEVNINKFVNLIKTNDHRVNTDFIKQIEDDNKNVLTGEQIRTRLEKEGITITPTINNIINVADNAEPVQKSRTDYSVEEILKISRRESFKEFNRPIRMWPTVVKKATFNLAKKNNIPIESIKKQLILQSGGQT